MMGDKTAARALAQKIGVPTCPARKSRSRIATKR
jgi:biotin carboxylase